MKCLKILRLRPIRDLSVSLVAEIVPEEVQNALE